MTEHEAVVVRQEDEARARELLAAEYEADGATFKAREVRDGQGISPDNVRSIRAIIAALASARKEAIEEAGKVAEGHSTMQCGPYTREVTEAIATAIRALARQDGGVG